MEVEDTIYDGIDKFEGSGGGCNIPWVDKPVSINGNSSYAGLFFRVVYLVHDFFIGCLSSFIHRYSFIPNYTELFSTRDTIFLGAFVAFSNALAETFKFIAVGFFPNIFVFCMVMEMALCKVLTCLSV